MPSATDGDRRNELAQQRAKMAELMQQIQRVTEQQITVINRCTTEDELESDPEYQALSQQKASLGDLYHSLAERADQLIELLGE